MKPQPRIRKTIKWGGAVVTVLLAVVWIGSGWGYACEGVSPVVFVDRGAVIVTGTPETMNGGALVSRGRRWPSWGAHRFGLYWRISNDSSRWVQTVIVPLWPFVAGIAVASLAAWFFDAGAGRARARLNLCPKCNYDRAGITADAKCPECGAGPKGV
jgi:hypothetical protein